MQAYWGRVGGGEGRWLGKGRKELRVGGGRDLGKGREWFGEGDGEGLSARRIEYQRDGAYIFQQEGRGML